MLVPKDYNPVPPKSEIVEKIEEVQSAVIDLFSGSLEQKKKLEDDLKDGANNPEPRISGK